MDNPCNEVTALGLIAKNSPEFLTESVLGFMVWVAWHLENDVFLDMIPVGQVHRGTSVEDRPFLTRKAQASPGSANALACGVVLARREQIAVDSTFGQGMISLAKA